MSNTRSTRAEDMQTSYGFRNVETQDKQPLVNDVFHSVAKKYDVMNDFMSAGLHRVWKNAMVAWLNPPKTGDYRVLDVAGGTGDIAFRIVEASQNNALATVLDINGSMLAVGKERSLTRGLENSVDFIEANAEELPFEDRTFDAYTIAFGIRNVPRIDVAIKEAYRVLKPGGRFLCLEFSEVDLPGLDKAYDFWSFNAIPQIGKMVAGDAESYSYLVESIRKFPNQETFKGVIENCGFERVSFRNYTGGIAALHSGWKL